MMKRIVAGLFLLLVAAMALLLIVPNFIDWNRHKETLAAHATAYMGREVKIGGDITFRLLPNPQLSVADVSVAAAEGAQQKHVLSLRQLEAKVRFRPLLEGRIEIEKIHLVEPALVLEIFADGRAGWQGLGEGDAARRPFTFGRRGETVKLEDVTLRGGRIRYIHETAGVDIGFDRLNLSVAAPSLRGPYKILGDMRFKDVPVNIEISTGQAGSGAGMLISALFQPVEKLPQLTLKGTLASGAQGVSFDGDMSLEQGALASLFSSDFLTAPAFMHQDMHLSAALSVRAGVMALKDISAQSGKDGAITGSVTYARPPMETPLLEAQLHLKKLPLGGLREASLPQPEGLRVKLAIGAEDTSWRGLRLAKVDLKAETAGEDWKIERLRTEWRDKTVLTASGTASPRQDTQSLRVVLDTPDLSAFGKAAAAQLPDSAAKILPLLPPQKTKIEGSLDIRPGRASLYNFSAQFGAGSKASGVVNLPAKGMEARLNLSGIDWTALPEDRRAALLAQILVPGTDIDITADAQHWEGLDLRRVVLQVSGRDNNISVEKFSGDIGANGHFDISGSFSSWPVAAAETAALDIKIKAPNAEEISASSGFAWPLFLNVPVPVDFSIHWRKNGQAMTYHIAGGFRGGTVDLKKPVADAPVKLLATMPDSYGLLSLFGLDIDRLVSPAGAAQLSADIAGDMESYIAEGLRITSGDVLTTGRIEKNAQGIRADLRTGTAHFDRWLGADMRQRLPLSLRLRADKAVARGLPLDKVETDMKVEDGLIEVSAFKAGIWSGALTAQGKLQRGSDKSWSAETKGDLRGLRPMQIPHGIAGLSADEADMRFALSAQAKGKEAFGEVKGDIFLSMPRLTIDGFDPAALAAYLEGIKGAPQDLATTAHKILRGGAATYADVQVDMARDDQKITLKSLLIGNVDSSVRTDATLDLGAGKYDLKSFMTLRRVEDLEPLEITRAGDAGKAPDYRLQAKQLTDFAARRMPPPEPEPLPAIIAEPAPVMTLPDADAEMLPPGYLSVPPGLPADEEGEDMLRDILPVEAETLAPPENVITPLPGHTPDTPAEETADEMPQPEAEAIRGILDRLGE